MLCSVCGPETAPRPTGVQTFTFNGVTHKTKKCAAISSLGEQPVRNEDGYGTKSGLLVCLDCSDRGQQHTYASGQDPHAGRGRHR